MPRTYTRWIKYLFSSNSPSPLPLQVGKIAQFSYSPVSQEGIPDEWTTFLPGTNYSEVVLEATENIHKKTSEDKYLLGLHKIYPFLTYNFNIFSHFSNDHERKLCEKVTYGSNARLKFERSRVQPYVLVLPTQHPLCWWKVLQTCHKASCNTVQVSSTSNGLHSPASTTIRLPVAGTRKYGTG